MTGARRGRLQCEYTKRVFEADLLWIGYVVIDGEWMWLLWLVLVVLARGLAGRNAASAKGSRVPLGCAAGGERVAVGGGRWW